MALRQEEKDYINDISNDDTYVSLEVVLLKKILKKLDKIEENTRS